MTSDGISVFQPSIAASFNDWPAHCGVAVSSELDQSGMHAHVTARVTSELTSEYRIVILVVQDRIKGCLAYLQSFAKVLVKKLELQLQLKMNKSLLMS